MQRDLDATQVKDIKNTWIGKKITVKIIEVDEERRKLVFSAIHAQEQKKALRLKELKQKEGQKVRGQVVNVVDFGLFIDLDGVDGLVHVSELDWVRVENLEERFKPGDEMDLQVLDVDMERERVTLSRKNLIPNPWEKLSERYKPGDVIRCKVARIMDFGAFVELPEGVQGLIPKNELGYTHTALPQEAVKVGETVLAIVLSLDEEGGRMALSMRQVPREKQFEWLLASEDAASRMRHQRMRHQRMRGMCTRKVCTRKVPLKRSPACLDRQGKENPHCRIQQNKLKTKARLLRMRHPRMLHQQMPHPRMLRLRMKYPKMTHQNRTLLRYSRIERKPRRMQRHNHPWRHPGISKNQMRILNLPWRHLKIPVIKNEEYDPSFQYTNQPAGTIQHIECTGRYIHLRYYTL